MPIDDTRARRHDLGGFLRAHRDLLTPEDVGLPRSPRRRTPGLRREEVAALSGVGVAWYTWLEQGRVDTSRHVLEAVSAALRLDADAHRHALELGGFHVALPGAGSGDEQAPPAGLRAMLAGWTTSPALVLGRDFGILARNDAWTCAWPDPDLLPVDRRNLPLVLLTEPEWRSALPDHEAIALDLVRHLRAGGNAGHEPSVVRALREARPDLADWWRCRAVGLFAPRTVDTRTFHPTTVEPRTTEALAPEPHTTATRVPGPHAPEVRTTGGSIALRFGLNLLTPAEAPGSTVLVCTPGDATTFAHMARYAPAATRILSA